MTDVRTPPVTEAQTAVASDTATVRGRQAQVLGPARLLVVPAVLLLIWYTLYLILGRDAVASPAGVAGEIRDGLSAGWLAESMLITLRTATMAFALATAAGLWLGFVLGLSRTVRTALRSPILWAQSIPKIVLFPVFLLLMGVGTSTNVAFASLYGAIPLAIVTMTGVAGTPSVLLRLGRSYRLGRWRTFWRVIVPNTLPTLSIGLRYCFSLCFIGVVLAEMFVSLQGAGRELIQAMTLSNLDRIFAIAVALAVVALLVNGAFLFVQRHLERHRPQPERSPL
ncbi:ABC transporter permease [Phytohabitans suffuscus]|uniref:ABC transmembrane type-1 domain-containing protein n=1 Tax=Phytohabitans suffuscus TaxID=624315 RepID=A0A6F8YEG0_9ACTN|nr:ABC transporter permease subunit [Phytohabitans suffuscus]BCB84524.1 hypothetical protein Psuf_018370 [Phytohabitans suffuscus]